LVNHHRTARVDLLGKGMTRYTSLNVSKHDDFALHKAIDKARYGYIGIVNANTELVGPSLLSVIRNSRTGGIRLGPHFVDRPQIVRLAHRRLWQSSSQRPIIV
jgi:hypothetical protein